VTFVSLEQRTVEKPWSSSLTGVYPKRKARDFKQKIKKLPRYHVWRPKYTLTHAEHSYSQLSVDASKGLYDFKKASSSREFVVDMREREEPVPICNSRFETGVSSVLHYTQTEVCEPLGACF